MNYDINFLSYLFGNLCPFEIASQTESGIKFLLLLLEFLHHWTIGVNCSGFLYSFDFIDKMAAYQQHRLMTDKGN
jgi:hypothetical protein